MIDFKKLTAELETVQSTFKARLAARRLRRTLMGLPVAKGTVMLIDDLEPVADALFGAVGQILVELEGREMVNVAPDETTSVTALATLLRNAAGEVVRLSKEAYGVKVLPRESRSPLSRESRSPLLMHRKLADALEAAAQKLDPVETRTAGIRTIILHANELDQLRSGRGSVERNGVAVYYD
jgi:hypothetical protein